MDGEKMNIEQNEGMNQHWDLEPMVTQNTGITPKKQLSIKKKLLITLAGIVGICMLCLCMIPIIKQYNRSRYKDEFYVQQEVLDYLEKRYDEKFVVMFNRGMDYAYNYVQLYAYPQGYTDEKYKFEIQGYYNKWGKLDYYDSYVMVKLTDEYEAYIDPIIGEYFDEYKFYMEFNSEWLTNNLPPDTKLDDLWELRANEDYPLPTLYVYLAPEQGMSIRIVRELCLELRETGLRGRVKTWELGEKTKYLGLDRNDWGNNYSYLDYNDVLTVFLYDNEIKIMEE